MKQFLRKHLPDQPFSRSTKPELKDELQEAYRKVENIEVAVNAVYKRLGSSTSGTTGQLTQDNGANAKKYKKLLEHQLGTSMLQASKQMKDDVTPFKFIMETCGNTEMSLVDEIKNHETKVEQMVCCQLNQIVEQDIPNVMKAKKHFTKLINEKDSAINRLSTQTRQGEQSKISQAQEEVEEAEVKAEQSLDALATEMFSLIIKESELAGAILQYMKLQRAYHESAMHVLAEKIPILEAHLDSKIHKRMFGISLEEHLRLTQRDIAFPIELCVCVLLELGLKEEGLLRMAASSSRLKRMKLMLDAGLLDEKSQLSMEYRDVHVIGGVLKSYLRELPEPLLTSYFHNKLLSAINNHNTEEARINELYRVIHLLPQPNYNNLQYLIKFLFILSQNHTENKMTPSNIAIVIAPNLLWCSNDGGNSSYDMGKTATINCVVELLVKHADVFFKENINFFVTINKDILLYEDGFHPQYGRGINGSNIMTRSMQENTSSIQSVNYESKPSGSLVQTKQSHSRSNSHDTNLIFLENEIKRAQSNSSLNDISSQSQGSPKPSSRTKKNKQAPVPPNFTPPDKNNKTPKTSSNLESVTVIDDSIQSKDKNINDKPDKPPRPSVNECPKIISGSQTVNRSSYKNKIANAKLSQRLSSSRENLADFSVVERRKSLDFEHENYGNEMRHTDNASQVNNTNQPFFSYHNTGGKMTVSEGCQTVTSISPRSSISAKSGSITPKQMVQSSSEHPLSPKALPVAAPRTFISKPDENTEVQLRHKPPSEVPGIIPGSKPAIPERPAILRPQSFRNSSLKQSLEMLASTENPQNGSTNIGTSLERAHVYSVEKQHPTFINVNNPQPTPTSRVSDSIIPSVEEENKWNIQRTNSTGSNNQNIVKSETQPPCENVSLTNQMRKLSQSEGNILDVPPSPRPYHKPQRPQVPAPPPPTMLPKSPTQETPDSTDL